MALFVSLWEESIVFLISQNVFLLISLQVAAGLPAFQRTILIGQLELCGTGWTPWPLWAQCPSGDEAAVGEVSRPTMITASCWW